MAKDNRAAFLEALKRQANRLYRLFREAFSNVHNSADVARLTRAIEAQDVEEIIRILRLSNAVLGDVYDAIGDALRAGADYQHQAAPQRLIAGLQLGFDGRHPRIEQWMNRHAAAFVTEVMEDQRALIREALTSGLVENRGYAAIARDLVGTRTGNQRSGGLIGLHSRQAASVMAARTQLQVLNSDYFSRKRRDKRFDKTVATAIREGRPLSRAQIARITRAYSGRLLDLRGRTISRTEGNRAMNAGRAEAMQQMIERGDVPVEAVTVIWDATPGPRTRDSHRALNGQTVAWGDRFVSPITGARMLWPYDETAPAEEVVNCRCSARFRVNWATLAA